MKSAVIVDAIRTPSGRGKPGGALSGVHPSELLAQTLQHLMRRTGIDPGTVDDVIAGCVSQVGDQALNIARTAWLAAGLPDSVPGTTVDRQCGSSQQAAHFGAQAVMAGAYDIVVVCGVESMSRVPMGVSSVGGDPTGLLSARYPDGLVNQGVSAELIADRWGLTRAALDAYSARSHRLATDAEERGALADHVVAVLLPDGSEHSRDETVRSTTTEATLSQLKPAFRTDELEKRFPQVDWRITPGNSSPLTDAASAVLIMSEERADALGLRPRARFVDFAVAGSDPLFMLTGVIPATQKLLNRSGVTIDAIDAYEVNEAFAPVPLAWAAEFDADPERLNPNGGAIALGHALGASGVRLLTTLLARLEETGGQYGLQTMCEGGGMANATLIERL